MSKGFTLIELMLVVMILGIAAAVAVPAFGHNAGRLELRQAAQDLAYTIRYGQMRAMSKMHVLRLNTDTKGYWLEESNADITDDATPVFNRIPSRIGRRTDLIRGVSMSQTDKEVTFLPDGRLTLASLRVCRGKECLVVSTGEQRGRVDIIDEEESNHVETP